MNTESFNWDFTILTQNQHDQAQFLKKELTRLIPTFSGEWHDALEEALKRTTARLEEYEATHI